MQISVRLSGGAIIVLALLGVGAWLLYTAYGKSTSNRVETTVVAPEVPVVMRTEGGLLEVATIKATERFTRADTKEFWGIPLGTTVSQIQVPVLYRYHIELARDWELSIQGKASVVRAPQLKPSLPVAFDTAALQKYSHSGWARFNSQENLATLERSITAELQARAQSDRYLQLATGAARLTVQEFVTRWLLKEQQWQRDPAYSVQVVFPEEPLPSQRAIQPSTAGHQ